jgi:hypothetical protein
MFVMSFEEAGRGFSDEYQKNARVILQVQNPKKFLHIRVSVIRGYVCSW